MITEEQARKAVGKRVRVTIEGATMSVSGTTITLQTAPNCWYVDIDIRNITHLEVIEGTAYREAGDD